MTNETLGGLERLTYMPDRPSDEQGDRIAGQYFYDVEFVGGSISNVTLTDVTINGVETARNERVVTASGNVTVASDDYIITMAKTVGQITTITLPATPTTSRSLIIKDGNGDAATYNITIDGNGNDIDGAATFVMATNYQAIEIVFNGTEWNPIGEYPAGSGGGGSGTVTTVSVVTANGFSGTVSNPTTTPAITIDVSALDAAKIADGSVSNTEFQYLDGVTSDIQTQINAKLENITGLITDGTNVTITGTGTSGDPYVINSSGGGSSAFDDITSGTNTTAAMVVGTGASLGVSGSGTIAATSAPLSGVSGLGTGVATFLATPSSANLASAVTDETGTGALVFANSPVFTTPNIGSATGSISGNAATATALETARTINGTSFDGTANITVTAAAGTLTGTTLNAGVTASSLTSVGTLTGGATASGFTVALGTSTITGQLALANGGTGANLSDPGADRILFWDDSAGAVTWLTAGTGLSITDTTISATASGDVTAASNLTDNAIVRGDGGAKGVQTSGIIIADTTDAVSGIGTITPKNDNTQQLGSTSNQWGDLFLGSGGVINWNNGGVTVTETSDSLQFAGATNYNFDNAITGTFVETLWIPAAAMRPSSSGGCGPLGLTATGANQPDLSYLPFDPTTAEYAQFSIKMPARWNLGALVPTFYWTHPSTTTNFGVAWNIQAVAVSNDDAIGTSFGTAATMTDTGGTTYDLYVTSSSSITVGGSPVAADELFFRVYRDPANGSDNMAVDAYLLGVKLRYTTTTLTDVS